MSGLTVWTCVQYLLSPRGMSGLTVWTNVQYMEGEGGGSNPVSGWVKPRSAVTLPRKPGVAGSSWVESMSGLTVVREVKSPAGRRRARGMSGLTVRVRRPGRARGRPTSTTGKIGGTSGRRTGGDAELAPSRPVQGPWRARGAVGGGGMGKRASGGMGPSWAILGLPVRRGRGGGRRR